jgi:glycosyltransferase involved in cell wall biosynthesis
MNQSKLPKMGIIGTVGVPARYGGFETLAHFLVMHLRKRFDLTIYCSGKTYKKEERQATWKGAKLHYIPLEANGLQSIVYDIWSMLHAIKRCDVLLVLGVSGCLFLPFLKLFTKKKVIVNIDGLEWKRAKWNKLAKTFLLWSEIIACRFADEIITDNRILKEYVRIRYGIKGNLVEYGADHVSKETISAADLQKYPFLSKNYTFKVARIEPENNLHTILEAYATLPHQPLVIVGNWNNSAYGKELKSVYNYFDHIYLLDPIYDPKELNTLRANAHLYVHGHSAGGTNPSLVEAMYLKLPIIAYDVIYNRITTNNQSLFFSDAKSLRKLVLNIEKYPLHAIANQMKKYAEKRYTWQHVANRYGNIVEGKERILIPEKIAKVAKMPPSIAKELALEGLKPEPTFKITENKEEEFTFGSRA